MDLDMCRIIHMRMMRLLLTHVYRMRRIFRM